MATPEESRQSILKRNLQYSDPNWKVTTFKTAAEEDEFQRWVKDTKAEFDPNDPHPDYDMRGFFKKMKEDPKAYHTSVNTNDGKPHYTDEFKTPYHKSFSNQSKWAKKGAPSWNDKDQLVTPSGKVVFDEREKN